MSPVFSREDSLQQSESYPLLIKCNPTELFEA